MNAQTSERQGRVPNSLGTQGSVFINRPTYSVGAAVANLLYLQPCSCNQPVQLLYLKTSKHIYFALKRYITQFMIHLYVLCDILINSALLGSGCSTEIHNACHNLPCYHIHIINNASVNTFCDIQFCQHLAAPCLLFFIYITIVKCIWDVSLLVNAIINHACYN